MYAVGKYGLPMYEHTSCTEISEKGVKCTDAEGRELFIPADSVFYGVGMLSDRELYYRISDLAPFVDIVGDCRSVGTVCGAMQTGYSAALDIGMF